ncbi:MAG: glycoside hydrolase family 65 protein, partial [Lachnospiraceae bacterium]|nr:glycoside hydrolase family 65 protein [Lachnospiraceae bacterium]
MQIRKLNDEGFESSKIPFWGNKYLIGNGYFGVRGTMEEYKKDNMPCVNLAGIYDKVGDKWRESVNAPNPIYTYIKVDSEAFALPEKDPFSHEQIIDIETAIHSRKTVWNTAYGKITVACERFASMANQHLICMKYSASADYDCEI